MMLEDSTLKDFEAAEAVLNILLEVLNAKSLDLDLGFFENGGDSLSMIKFTVEILKKYDLGISTELILDANSIRQMIKIIAERISTGNTTRSASTNEKPIGMIDRLSPTRDRYKESNVDVAMIANRFSYFFKRKKNLTHWNVCSNAIPVNGALDISALSAAVDNLVFHHEGLRMRLSADMKRQYIAPADEVNMLMHEKNCGDIDNPDFSKKAVAKALETFSFPGDLFKVLIVEGSDGAFQLFILSHHLLIDAFSLEIIKKDLFDLYAQHHQRIEICAPRQTLSMREYARSSTEHWLREKKEECSYWNQLYWKNISPIPIDFEKTLAANCEEHSKTVVESRNLSEEPWLSKLLASSSNYEVLEILIVAIGSAYEKWTGQKTLQIATVFHGRESFLPGIDLSNTVGWISETVPIVIDQKDGDLVETAADIAAQIRHASVKGKSYGVLKYFCDDAEIKSKFSSHPEPQISLNYVPRNSATLKDHRYFSEERKRPEDPFNKEGTERVFLLSGGVYTRDGKFHISWDFSDRIFDVQTIRRFCRDCIDEFTFIGKHYTRKRKA